MARYIQDITLNQPDEFVNFMMDEYLSKSGFEPSVDWKGEPCFKYSDVRYAAYKYIIWSYMEGVFHIEAWLKGSVSKEEMGFEGIIYCVPKRRYKSSIENLILALKQPLPNERYENIESIKQAVRIQVEPFKKSKNATVALVVGILSLIELFVIPFASIFTGIYALKACNTGLNTHKKNQAKIGKICGIIGIALGIIFWIFDINILMMVAINIAGL